MADAHMEKQTASLQEDLKGENAHTVAERGHAATDMYVFSFIAVYGFSWWMLHRVKWN
jgi:hypothetical protein